MKETTRQRSRRFQGVVDTMPRPRRAYEMFSEELAWRRGASHSVSADDLAWRRPGRAETQETKLFLVEEAPSPPPLDRNPRVRSEFRAHGTIEPGPLHFPGSGIGSVTPKQLDPQVVPKPRRPTTLGNGLYGTFRRVQANTFPQLVADLGARARAGLRPICLNVHRSSSDALVYSALVVADMDANCLWEVAEYPIADLADALYGRYVDQPSGFRPVWVSAEWDKAVVVWIRDQWLQHFNYRWLYAVAALDDPELGLHAQLSKAQANGWRPISLAISRDSAWNQPATPYYVAIFVDDADTIPAEDWVVDWNMAHGLFRMTVENDLAADIVPICIDSYPMGSGASTEAAFAYIGVRRQHTKSSAPYDFRSNISGGELAAFISGNSGAYLDQGYVPLAFTQTAHQERHHIVAWRGAQPPYNVVDLETATIQSGQDDDGISIAVKQYMEATGTTAGAVAIWYRGERLVSRAFTVGDEGVEILTPNSPMRIASVSKAISAVVTLRALQDLANAGTTFELKSGGWTVPDLDTRVFDLADDEGFLWTPPVPPYPGLVNDVTLRDLLRHAAGWSQDTNDISGLGLPPPPTDPTLPPPWDQVDAYDATISGVKVVYWTATESLRWKGFPSTRNDAFRATFTPDGWPDPGNVLYVGYYGDQPVPANGNTILLGNTSLYSNFNIDLAALFVEFLTGHLSGEDDNWKGFVRYARESVLNPLGTASIVGARTSRIRARRTEPWYGIHQAYRYPSPTDVGGLPDTGVTMLYGGRQQFEGLADHHVPPYPQPAIAPGFGPLPPDYGLAPPFVAAAYGSNVVMEQRLPSAGWLSSVNDLARFASALDSYDVGSDMVAENGTVILERSWVTEMLTSNLPFDFNQRLGWDRRASTTTPPVNNPGSLPSRGLTPPGVNLNAYFKWGGTTGTRALVYHRVDGLNIAFSFNRLGAGADGLRDALAEAANWILYA